jgi:hypothetical protein
MNNLGIRWLNLSANVKDKWRKMGACLGKQDQRQEIPQGSGTFAAKGKSDDNKGKIHEKSTSKSGEIPFRTHCRENGHVSRDCRGSVGQQASYHSSTSEIVNLSDYVAPLYAAQVVG